MIAEKVRAALGRELKRDPGTIEMHHLLREDLGLNSLDAIELMFKVEEEFDLEIPDADLQKLKTVGDLVSYLEVRLARSAAPTVGPPEVSAPAAAPVPVTKAVGGRAGPARATGKRTVKRRSS